MVGYPLVILVGCVDTAENLETAVFRNADCVDAVLKEKTLLGALVRAVSYRIYAVAALPCEKDITLVALHTFYLGTELFAEVLHEA